MLRVVVEFLCAYVYFYFRHDLSPIPIHKQLRHRDWCREDLCGSMGLPNRPRSMVFLNNVEVTEQREMKSKNRTIEVNKASNLGTMPMFIQMTHRHFEKENPPEAFSVGSVKTYRAPVDLLRLTVSDPALTRDIEEVTFTYGKRQ